MESNKNKKIKTEHNKLRMNPLHFELFPASARPFKSIEFRLLSWKQTKTLSQHTNAKKKIKENRGEVAWVYNAKCRGHGQLSNK